MIDYTPLPFDPYDFSKTEIDNIPVYYKNLPWAPCIHIYISFDIGAFNDPVGKEGLSHFLEHMIFDGSPSLPDRKAVHEWRKKEALNSWNAYTSHYNTAYHLQCLPEKFKDVFLMMKEQVFSPLLRDEDVEHERKVITQEAWENYQNKKLLSYIKEFTKKVFPKHSLSRVTSALGWPDTVASIQADDIRLWHKENYHKGNMKIVIAGNINDETIEILKENVGDIKESSPIKKLRESVPKPEINEITKSADEIGLDKEQVEISISTYRDIPNYKREHERIFTILLHDILHEKLRDEKALCYGVHTSVKRGVDYVNLSIDIKTSEEHIETVKKLVKEEIFEILNTKTYVDKFEQVKKTNLEQVRSTEHDTRDIIHHVTGEVVRIDKIRSLNEVLSDRENTTFEDIQKAGLYITDPLYMVTEVILPSKK
ncbi:MAG: M16 family metallopeptidase [Minisyncoccota bacterium]